MYKPNKKLGQNFLNSKDVVRQMIEALEIGPNDTIVEIGPGLGALTLELSESIMNTGSEVFAVEVDERFIPKLNNMFIKNPNLFIIEADILDWLPTYQPEESFKIIGSLPYYITSPIIHRILSHSPLPSIAVLMVQKEVGGKILKEAPDNSYISAITHTFCDVDKVTVVSKKEFSPSPKVESIVIKMKLNKDVQIQSDEFYSYERFLHRAFKNPRKMLNKAFTKEELLSVGIDPTLRPQHVPTDKFIDLYKSIKK